MRTAVQKNSHRVARHACVGGTFCQHNGSIGGARPVDIGFHATQIRVKRERCSARLRANRRLEFARVHSAIGGPLGNIAQAGETRDALHGHFIRGDGPIPLVRVLHLKFTRHFRGQAAGIQQIRVERGGNRAIKRKRTSERGAHILRND